MVVRVYRCGFLSLGGRGWDGKTELCWVRCGQVAVSVVRSFTGAGEYFPRVPRVRLVRTEYGLVRCPLSLR